MTDDVWQEAVNNAWARAWVSQGSDLTGVGVSQEFVEAIAKTFDVPVDMIRPSVYRNDTIRPSFWSSVGLSPWTRYDKVIEVVHKADMHSRFTGWGAWGLGPVHPADVAALDEAYGVDPRYLQPWLWTYPPLVVDKDRLGAQIDALLDPTLAIRTWVYDQFGLVVNHHDARMIAAIHKGQVHLPEHWRAPL